MPLYDASDIDNTMSVLMDARRSKLTNQLRARSNSLTNTANDSILDRISDLIDSKIQPLKLAISSAQPAKSTLPSETKTSVNNLFSQSSNSPEGSQLLSLINAFVSRLPQPKRECYYQRLKDPEAYTCTGAADRNRTCTGRTYWMCVFATTL